MFITNSSYFVRNINNPSSAPTARHTDIQLCWQHSLDACTVQSVQSSQYSHHLTTTALSLSYAGGALPITCTSGTPGTPHTSQYAAGLAFIHTNNLSYNERQSGGFILIGRPGRVLSSVHLVPALGLARSER